MAETTPAVWLAGASSRRQEATLSVADGQVVVTDAGGAAICQARQDEVKVSSRLANVPRQLQLPGGVVLSVADNDFVDRMLPGSGWLHGMESRWRWLLALAAAVAVLSYWAFAHGLPAMGDHVARQVPQQHIDTLGKEVYDRLVDAGFLQPSRLDEAQRRHLQRLFGEVARDYPDIDLMLWQHRLVLFDDEGEANAFALPNGYIVLTDELAAALTDDEIRAVMAHEIGHVHHRHSMRSLVQVSGVAGIIGFLLGDYSGLSLLPLALAESKYSRDFEREADCFAAGYLARHGLPLSLIGSALAKLEQHAAEAAEEDDDALDLGDSRVLAVLLVALSTHPPTAERHDLAQHCSAAPGR